MHEVIDFSRSFLCFSTSRVNHTPRLVVAAACTLQPPGGEPLTCYLTCPCVGEAMYVETGLIHQPVSEFRLIAAPRDQFLLLKVHADASLDVTSAHRFGDVMPTHDGRGARVIGLDVTLRHAAASPLLTCADFRRALLDGVPVVGRTTCTDPHTGDRIVLDYPATTLNIANDRDAWQVDAGPLVLPHGPARAQALPVARLRPAYLVYNRFDYAEYAVLDTTPVAGGATRHYAHRVAIACRHELFAVA